MSGLTFLWAARVSSLVIVGDLLWCIVFYRDLSNNTNGVVIETLWCVFRVSLLLLFFTFSFSFPFTIHEGHRKNKEEKNKKTLKIYRSFHDDITSTLGKISMGRIQRHQESPSTVTGVGHTNRPKTSVLRYLWTTGVTHSIHNW